MTVGPPVLVRAEATAETGAGRARAGHLVGMVMVSSIALMTAACGGGEHAVEAVAARDPITVQVQAATKASRAAMVEAGGLVQAKTTAIVTAG